MNKNSIFIFLGIIVLYLDVPLFLGDFMLPSVTGIAFLIFFSVLYAPRAHQLKCLLALEGLLLGYLAFGFAGHNLGSFISSQQLVVGVMLFSYLIIYTRKISDTTLSNVLAFTIVSFAFLSQLEVYTAFKEVSDSFRNWAYGDTFYFYADDNRDIEMVGSIRPKVFAPEPSSHTNLLSILLLCYKFVTVKSARLIDFIILILCTAVYFSTQSPPLLLSIAIYLFLSLHWSKNLFLKIILMLAFSIILIIAFSIILGMSGGIQLDGFSRFSNFGDVEVVSSSNVRLLFPVLTMIDVLQHYPLFGIGIGNKEALVSISSLYVVTNNDALMNENILLGSFAIPRLFIYFGLFGTWIFLIIICKTVLIINSVQILRFSMVCFVLIFSFGAFEAVYFWCLLSICYRCCLSNATHNQELNFSPR